VKNIYIESTDAFLNKMNVIFYISLYLKIFDYN